MTSLHFPSGQSLWPLIRQKMELYQYPNRRWISSIEQILVPGIIRSQLFEWMLSRVDPDLSVASISSQQQQQQELQDQQFVKLILICGLAHSRERAKMLIEV